MNLETIELELDEENGGVHTISFVEFPAMESNFYAFNEHKVEFKSIDDDKRIVVGVALIPDKEIPRNGKDGMYNVIMSKETVKRASEFYLQNHNQHSANLDHNKHKTVDGCCVVESWIVEDTKFDKSALYGLDAPLGSWVVSYKIDNDDVWADVKEGKYLGFSIEGFLKPKEAEPISEEDEIIAKLIKLLE